jgi:hypothetical protein
MSSEAHAMEWYARTLRAWHLAILRFALTLNNADRLAVLRIAREIDGPDSQQDGSADFEFFRRTSAELCAAILQPNERASAVLKQYLGRIDDDCLKRTFAARSTPASRPSPRSAGPRDRVITSGRGFPPAAIIEGDASQRGPFAPVSAASVQRADARSRPRFSRHFGPGPRM